MKNFIKNNWHFIVIVFSIGLLFFLANYCGRNDGLGKIEKNINNINAGYTKILDGYKEMHNNLVEIGDVLKTLAKNDSIQSEQLRHYPSSQPITITNNTKVTSLYDQRVNPISHELEFHWGIDYSSNKGTPVMATADGRVIESGVSDGYGNVVKINHLNGYYSLYAHLDKILVKDNQLVKRGDIIGTVGSTGYSTGNHLHYEVQYLSQLINPRIFY